jgi:taurine dioxygenase
MMGQDTLTGRSLTAEPVTGAIGARVSGLDVRAVQTPAVCDELTRLLHEHGVLFFSTGEPVTDEEHKQFARAFGEIQRFPYRFHDDDPDFITIDTAVTPSDKYRTNRWHTDGTPEECPPQAALLRGVMLPPYGGDTMWASMYAAYESLSSHYQRFLDGLEASHSTAESAKQLPKDFGMFGDGQSTLHPVVLRDPVTGRKALYVNSNYTERIVGLTDTESDTLLQMLFEHVNTPEFHVRLRWEPDTIAVWEERVTQHRVVADHHAARRIVKRVTIVGDRPTS